MAINVRFLKGTAAQYSAATKDLNTFYFTTDDQKVYLGEIELSTPAGVSAAIALVNDSEKGNVALKTALDSLLSGENSVESQIEEALKGELGEAELTTTAKTVKEALNELKTALDTAVTNAAVTIEKSTSVEGVAARYTIKQGGNAIATTIDIPKDMVVTSGEVLSLTDEQAKAINSEYVAGQYIKLVIANSANSELYIPVNSLVDEYVAAQNADAVQVAINGRTVSATLVDGGVSTSKLANGAVTTVKIADDAITTIKVVDKAITEAKLSDEVAAKLNSGDSALQASDIIETISTGNNGTFTVKTGELTSKEVAIKGLKSAAYVETTAFDAAGAADTAKNEVIGTLNDNKDATTIYGAKAYAKDYADGLAGDYATAAQGAKADSAVQKADITTGTTNGTIKVQGDEISVAGLGSAAYTASTAYDAAGRADAAEAAAKAYVDSALTWQDIA